MLEINDALLIYNLTSGRKSHRRFVEIEQAARILKDAGIATELAPTTGPGSSTKMARRAVEQRRGMVIACGGDGTINEIVNGLAGSRVPMALLPAGTANILAKELGIPWDIPKAARLIPPGIVRRIAAGIALFADGNHSTVRTDGGRYFLLVAGAGPDGAIVNNVNEVLKKNAGILAYWAEGLRQLIHYKFPKLCIHSADKDLRATMIIVGRTAHYGGPFKITTGASLFEDSFEMLSVAKHGRFAYLQCLLPLWLGKLRKLDGIEAWKATEAVCEPCGAEPVYAQVDGEPIGPVPVTFRLVPDALSLVTPPARET